MRPSRTMLKVAIVLFVTVQLVLASAALLGPRPGRFGWQMYSGYVPVPAVWREDATGTLHQIDVERLIAYGRAEIDFTSALVRSVCTQPDTAAVVTAVEDGRRSRFPCG